MSSKVPEAGKVLLFFFFNAVQLIHSETVTQRKNWKSTAHPVHLHVLELQAKVVALDEVAPQEDLGEEGLSQSLRLAREEEEGNCLSLRKRKIPRSKEGDISATHKRVT